MQSREIRNRCFLKIAVGDQHHRAPWRRHRYLVASHRGLGEVGQRNWQIVPFCIIADHRGCILRAVIPLDSRPPCGRVNRISENNENRYATRKRVIDAHCCML